MYAYIVFNCHGISLKWYIGISFVFYIFLIFFSFCDLERWGFTNFWSTCLGEPKFVVQAIICQELRVSSFLYNPSVRDDENDIRMDDCT